MVQLNLLFRLTDGSRAQFEHSHTVSQTQILYLFLFLSLGSIAVTPRPDVSADQYGSFNLHFSGPDGLALLPRRLTILVKTPSQCSTELLNSIHQPQGSPKCRNYTCGLPHLANQLLHFLMKEKMSIFSRLSSHPVSSGVEAC